jgi:L-iditol 2-dehydrogenase
MTLPVAMDALVIEQPGTIVLRRLPVPRPTADEVLVRVAAAGICGSDVELLEGRRPREFVRYPVVPGHEWAGTVEAVGVGVEGLWPGDIVVAEGLRACGDCARCREGRTNLCTAEYAETGFTHQGAFAEFVSVPARLVHRLPDGTDLAAAAVLEPAACIAQGLLEADLRPGLAAAVVGAGTLGLLAVALLRLSTPSRLALVGRRRPRLELGGRLGASETYDVGTESSLAELDGVFDLVIEAGGTGSSVASALRLARRGGTVVLAGISGRPGGADADAIVLGHLRVQGVFGASRAAWLWVVELAASGLLDTGALVSHSFPLTRHANAFATLADRDGDALKVQLTPQ